MNEPYVDSRFPLPEPSVDLGTGHGSFIVDGRGIVLGFDPEIESLTGWLAVHVVGRHKNLGGDPASTNMVGLPEPAPPLYEGMIPVPTDSEVRDLRLFSRDGRTIDVEVRLTRLSGSGDRVAVSVLRILARSEAPDSSTGAGARDPLTGLTERSAFMAFLSERFDAAAANGLPVALILADVDHMRRINDQFGRRAGDDVLRRLAGIFRAAVQDEDLIARLGDDDFAIALIGSGRREAREVAGRLRATVERFRFFDVRLSKDPARVTLSIGSASFPADADKGSDLVDRARESLTEARQHGRNRVWCYARRTRVPVRTPVYFDGSELLLVGMARDLSPSGMFVQTPAPLGAGMRCALAFPLPGSDGNVHVIGRVVRAVPPRPVDSYPGGLSAGMAIEFERFGPEDRTAIERFLHRNEALIPRNGNDELIA